MARAHAGISGDRADPVWLVLPLLGWLSLAGAAETGHPPVARELPPLSVRGINYFPRETPWGGMWAQTPREVWEKDMALAASLGANALRTFVQFSPRLVEAGLLRADGSPEPAYLKKLDDLLGAAWAHGIRVILCLDFSAEWLAAPDAPDRWRRALAPIVSAHRDDGRLLLWDLMNEPDDDSKWNGATRAYLREAGPFIRATDANHLTTIGMTWRIERIREVGLPDVLQYHEYCPKGPLFERGPARVAETIGRLRGEGEGRPLLIGEFGMCTSRDPAFGAEAPLRAKIGEAPGTEDDQAKLYEIVLSAAEEASVAGAIAWCLHDYPIRNPNESHFGVIRGDGSLKPAARVLQSFFERWRARE